MIDYNLYISSTIYLFLFLGLLFFSITNWIDADCIGYGFLLFFYYFDLIASKELL
jgi:hypothetical protein